MNKVKKIVLIVVLIFILFFVINVIRNYIILNNIRQKVSKIKELASFSETIKTGNVETKITKYNNIAKIEKSNSDIIEYYNISTDEMIEENVKTGEKTITSEKTASIELHVLDLEHDFLGNVLTNIITVKDINGEKCYKINVNDIIYYVSVDTGLSTRVMFNDSEKVDYINYELDNVEEIEFESDNV